MGFRSGWWGMARGRRMATSIPEEACTVLGQQPVPPEARGHLGGGQLGVRRPGTPPSTANPSGNTWPSSHWHCSSSGMRPPITKRRRRVAGRYAYARGRTGPPAWPDPRRNASRGPPALSPRFPRGDPCWVRGPAVRSGRLPPGVSDAEDQQQAGEGQCGALDTAPSAGQPPASAGACGCGGGCRRWRLDLAVGVGGPGRARLPG